MLDVVNIDWPALEKGAGHACRCERQVGLRTQSILILARVGHIAVNNVKIQRSYIVNSVFIPHGHFSEELHQTVKANTLMSLAKF